MLPIKYALINSIPSLVGIDLSYSTIEILFHCYQKELISKNNTVQKNAYEQSIRNVAAHYYGFECDDVNELISAIHAYEYDRI